MSKKVLVLSGGFSAEREVSLVSGQGVAEALKNGGYEVVCHDLKDMAEFIRVLNAEKPDVVFNALHGNWGEDGEIQALLDMLQVPYTHSGMLASAIGMNKVLTKMLVSQAGVKVVQGDKMKAGTFKQLAKDLPMPYVVKPVSDGSSVGVYIIRKPEDADAAVYDNDETEVMVERFIDGKELTCMCLQGKAYVVTELRSKVNFYDYHAKYTNGATEHILPAEIPEDVAETCKRYAEIVHRTLGCRTVSRCDFRYNPADGVVFLEVNTHPGLTPLSLVPEQAKYAGISYEQLCAMLVEDAGCRKMQRG